MKHIKRKFLFHDALQKSDIFGNLTSYEKKDVNQEMLKKNSKNNFAILTTESGEKVFSFIYNDNGVHCMIPVPDFSLVNHNFAYTLNIERKEHRKKLVKNLADLNIPNEMSNTFAYDYQGCASSCIICLFTAIECFVNNLIPEDFKYEISSERKTEIYNKQQIQISISLMDKLTKVLPNALGKNFFSNPTPTNSHIYNLKDLRNEIIHTKSDPTGQNNVEILKRLLNFKYDQALTSTFKLFNFYKEGFIEECPCEKDW
jgi:Fe-S cluster assembly scaffold protein SufB